MRQALCSTTQLKHITFAVTSVSPLLKRPSCMRQALCCMILHLFHLYLTDGYKKPRVLLPFPSHLHLTCPLFACSNWFAPIYFPFLNKYCLGFILMWRSELMLIRKVRNVQGRASIGMSSCWASHQIFGTTFRRKIQGWGVLTTSATKFWENIIGVEESIFIQKG